MDHIVLRDDADHRAVGGEQRVEYSALSAEKRSLSNAPVTSTLRTCACAGSSPSPVTVRPMSAADWPGVRAVYLEGTQYFDDPQHSGVSVMGTA